MSETQIVKICTERLLNKHINRFNNIKDNNKLKAAFYRKKIWPVGSTITISFIGDGNSIQKTSYSSSDKVDPLQHQIQNMNSNRRLKWTLIPPGYVLANSCNFVSIDPQTLGDFGILELYALLGVLNSGIQNERFKLLSPNNHISNSDELDELELDDELDDDDD
jgi:hypothetical protein